MVNGPLHAGDITVGEPIYMHSLARARTLRYVKLKGVGIVRRRYAVVKWPFEPPQLWKRLSNNITSFRPFPANFAIVTSHEQAERVVSCDPTTTTTIYIF